MVAQLSGGNQQKVVLARWLLRRVPGPPARRADAWRRRGGEGRALPRSSPTSPAQGLGVVVVSSEIEELCGLCTRILVMREGELVAELDGAQATELDVLRHAMPGTQEMVDAGEPTGHRHRRRGA